MTSTQQSSLSSYCNNFVLTMCTLATKQPRTFLRFYRIWISQCDLIAKLLNGDLREPEVKPLLDLWNDMNPRLPKADTYLLPSISCDRSYQNFFLHMCTNKKDSSGSFNKGFGTSQCPTAYLSKPSGIELLPLPQSTGTHDILSFKDLSANPVPEHDESVTRHTRASKIST